MFSLSVRRTNLQTLQLLRISKQPQTNHTEHPSREFYMGNTTHIFFRRCKSTVTYLVCCCNVHPLNFNHALTITVNSPLMLNVTRLSLHLCTIPFWWHTSNIPLLHGHMTDSCQSSFAKMETLNGEYKNSLWISYTIQRFEAGKIFNVLERSLLCWQRLYWTYCYNLK